MGNHRKPKTLHSKTHHERRKGNISNFFTKQDHSIQIAVPKGKSVNARFYKGKLLHKLKNISQTVDKQLVSVMTMHSHAKRPL